MSRVNRKKKRRNQIIRIVFAVALVCVALFLFINAIVNTLLLGLNSATGFYGIGIMIVLFVAGMLVSPEMSEWKKTKVPLPYVEHSKKEGN